MLKVVRRFKRISENLKEYKPGDIVKFDAKTEATLIANGYAVNHVQPKKAVTKKPKKK